MNQGTLVQEVETDEDSIVATFADLARELRLPELDWEFLYEHGETIVEGRPHAVRDVVACPRWARFLGMSELHQDPQGRCDLWFGINGPWTLEILAEVR
ncbi:MAG TPA: hypothetical protein VHX87_12050 [Galbitalea sp.]|jgi:hypothetical protein|nr:hypothetical protein [Galbitalea sp.]